MLDCEKRRVDAIYILDGKIEKLNKIQEKRNYILECLISLLEYRIQNIRINK